MRSDSTRLSPVFLKDAFHYIETIYGKEYKGQARQKNDENAQDAHEAIRPTNVMNTPESVKQYLTNDQYKLYHLIYSRTIGFADGAKQERCRRSQDRKLTAVSSQPTVPR